MLASVSPTAVSRRRRLRVDARSKVWVREDCLPRILARNFVRNELTRTAVQMAVAADDSPGFPVRLNFLSRRTGYMRVMLPGPVWLWMHDSEVMRV